MPEGMVKSEPEYWTGKMCYPLCLLSIVGFDYRASPVIGAMLEVNIRFGLPVDPGPGVKGRHIARKR